MFTSMFMLLYFQLDTSANDSDDVVAVEHLTAEVLYFNNSIFS